MKAEPFEGSDETVKLGAESPSLVSVNVRVPVMELSSDPEPELVPPKVPPSLRGLMVRETTCVWWLLSSSVARTVKESDPLKLALGV